MSTQLLEIHPLVLKFTFEVKKQSSCAIHLSNVSDQYVAFKVKTTSPKNYCVRPNIGIIKPKSACDFTVTMQAQRSAPFEMQCKDKFLILSTIVPFGTNEDDITPGMFAKDRANYVEENKLRVVLVNPPHSPVLLPLNGVLKQEPLYETSIHKEKSPRGVENLPPPHKLDKGAEDIRSLTHMEEPRPNKVVDNKESSPVKSVEFRSAKDEEPSFVKDVVPSLVKDVESHLEKDVEPRMKDVEGKKLTLVTEKENLKAKLDAVDSKLIEAELTISKLKEEGCTTIQVMEKLKQELAELRRTSDTRRIQVGFPLLFVCMVSMISLAVGFQLATSLAENNLL